MKNFDPLVRRCFQMAFISLQLLTLSEKYFRFDCFINCLVLFLNVRYSSFTSISTFVHCIFRYPALTNKLNDWF